MKKLILAILLLFCTSAVKADNFDKSLGAAFKITEHNGDKYYWRIPVIYKSHGVQRQVGFIDLSPDYTVKRRSVINVTNDDELKGWRQETTEMSYGQIVEHAKKFLNKDAKVNKGPVLMYDNWETKIVWVIKMEWNNRITVLAITPAYTYELTPP